GVWNYGKISIASGGTLTGEIYTYYGEIHAAGGTIDFALDASDKNTHRLSDYTAFYGTAKYTMTVAAGSQATGIYYLAGYASSFTNTITVRNSTGMTYGTIKNGNGSLQYGNRRFDVWCDGSGDLLLEVSEIAAASELWRLAQGDFNGDDVLTGLYMDENNRLYDNSLNGVAKTNNRIGTLADGWEIAAVADYNKDGKDDLMLQNSDGTVEYWGVSTDNRWKTIAPSKTAAGMLA
ncbi:MAG: VCBS repeat-containing protein, partial [Lentisphaeria bacterium]|nr:VCBS repeat-containing protein [Lentisphaeria bacterium]